FPAVASEAAIGRKGDAAVTAWADGLVATLADLGGNLNLAPVVDLNINPRNPAIGALGRAFSADTTCVPRDAPPDVVAPRARDLPRGRSRQRPPAVRQPAGLRSRRRREDDRPDRGSGDRRPHRPGSNRPLVRTCRRPLPERRGGRMRRGLTPPEAGSYYC